MEPAWKPGTDTGVIASPAAPRMPAPQFRILGPLEIRVGESAVDLPGDRPRRLLARLLLDPGRVVSVDGLIDAVWDGHPPARADVTLRSHVASLRRAIQTNGVDALLVTRPPGYLLRITPEQVDMHHFERGIHDGKVALERGNAVAAANVLRGALDLWRGPLLEDLGPPRFAEAEAAHLQDCG